MIENEVKIKKNFERKEVLKLVIPAVLEELLSTFSIMIDTKMVANLGVACISAIAVVNQPKFFLFAPFTALNVVLNSKIAFLVGNKNRDRANNLFLTSLLIVILLSIIMSVVSIIFVMPIMYVCSGQKDTMVLSATYFKIIMGGMVFNHLFLAINAIYRGCGRYGVTFISNIVSCFINIIFDYFLIEGHCGFPALGVVGAALATVIGTMVALLIDVIFLFLLDEFVSIRYCIVNKIKASIDVVCEIIDMWKNVFVENIFMRLGFLIASSINARIGSFEMAVYSVASYILNVNASFGRGFQNASVTLIGKYMGSEKYKEVKKCAFMMNTIGITYAIGLAVIIGLLSKWYCGLFSKDVVFVESGYKICWMIAIVCLVQIPKFVYVGVLQGMGEMKATRNASIIAIGVVQPFTSAIFVIGFKMGIMGICIALIVTDLVWMLLNKMYCDKYIKKL